MWRHIASNAMTLFVLILFLVGGVILWGRGQYVNEGPLEAAICLKVDRGSNMRRVSANLEEQGYHLQLQSDELIEEMLARKAIN